MFIFVQVCSCTYREHTGLFGVNATQVYYSLTPVPSAKLCSICKLFRNQTQSVIKIINWRAYAHAETRLYFSNEILNEDKISGLHSTRVPWTWTEDPDRGPGVSHGQWPMVRESRTTLSMFGPELFVLFPILNWSEVSFGYVFRIWFNGVWPIKN